MVVGADTDRHLYIHDAANSDVPVGGDRSNAVYVFALPAER